jgi:hypothetical protein
MEAQALSFEVASVNIRPAADELALGEPDARVWRFDPEARDMVGSVTALPSPFDATAAHTLPDVSRRRLASPHRRPAQSAVDPAYIRAPVASAGARSTRIDD